MANNPLQSLSSKGVLWPLSAILRAKSRHIPGALWVAIHHSAVGHSLWGRGARRPTLSPSQPFTLDTMYFLAPYIMSSSFVSLSLFFVFYSIPRDECVFWRLTGNETFIVFLLQPDCKESLKLGLTRIAIHQ